MFPPYQQQQIWQLAGVLSAVMIQQLLVRKNNDGLVLAAEVLLATPAVKNLIREGKAYQIPDHADEHLHGHDDYDRPSSIW